MEQKKGITVLEKSTNTHITKSPVKVITTLQKMTTIVIDTNNSMIVEHGTHNTVATEKDTKRVIKITQQEYNPITKARNNAYD